MNQTRYCSTCGTLLSQGAAICGECGARYQDSPYERRATDAPGAWSQAPRARSRDLGQQQEAPPEGDGIELISRESLTPREPGATALRTQEQYDQMMVTQQPSQPSAQSAASAAPAPTGSHASGAGAQASAGGEGTAMEPPMDGCVPASPIKRLLAALVDAVIGLLVMIPLTIGLVLVLTQESVGLLATILVGVGAALPAAYTVLMLWLHGAKGFTLGKLILGLRTARGSTGGPMGLLRSLGRWVLYGLVPPVMALSVFLDPKKQLRGFHDRAVDSVVVDAKAGRNPMKPRPDDFERQGAEHYLGSSSVAVTTHDNLMTTPGAAWAGQADAAADGTGQESPSAGSWGAGPGVPSPYAPPAQDSQPDDGGWAPPEILDVPPAHPSASSAGPAALSQEQQAWQQPSPQQPSPQWEAPPSAQPSTQPEAGQGWGAPPPQQQEPGFGQLPPAPQQAPSQDWQAPAPQQPPAQTWQAPAGPQDALVPSELTADAWAGSDVDEETRAAFGDPQDRGDLEQTRVSAVAPRLPRLTLRADDGTERTVSSAVVVGRNPTAGEGEVQFVLKDETRSMSKTHLRVDGTGEDITVTDLGSTNGSAIIRADGSRETLVPHTPTVLPPGASLSLGDRAMTVEKDS